MKETVWRWGVARAGIVEMLHGLVCHAWPPVVFGERGRGAWSGEAETDRGESFNPVFLCPLQTNQSERRPDTEPAGA